MKEGLWRYCKEIRRKAEAVCHRPNCTPSAATVCQPTDIVHTEPELRTWANDSFHDLAHVAQGNAPFDTTRRVLHTYVQRIEIEPIAKRGTLFIPADPLACWHSKFSTRVTLGDSLAMARASSPS